MGSRRYPLVFLGAQCGVCLPEGTHEEFAVRLDCSNLFIARLRSLTGWQFQVERQGKVG
jgi:hypothetical protein